MRVDICGGKDSRSALAVLECKERPGAKFLAPLFREKLKRTPLPSPGVDWGPD